MLRAAIEAAVTADGVPVPLDGRLWQPDRIGSDHIIVGLEKVRRAEEGGGKLVWNANPPKCHKDHTQLLHNIISMLLKKLYN